VCVAGETRPWWRAGPAASFLAMEKNFRRIMGWKDLWQPEAILGRKAMETAAVHREVAKHDPSTAPSTSN
jgi:hypothetical protein